MFYILTYCMLLCIMNLKLQKRKGLKNLPWTTPTVATLTEVILIVN